ncbi:high mobility group protein dsp1 [Anaeramoeba ignava]|uniref:High mobility group protein dsp1 n=1 Tax=Anaeramoeba ignava TaxID=1746090 RepID=A0A9Q0RBI1_ANAIG|nr:high mobility group protein dsp1 [Anaeramoeba ignava]
MNSEEEKQKQTKESKEQKEPKQTTKAVENEAMPQRPKYPQNAFFMFAQEMRPHLISVHKGITVSELGKLIGKAWSKCDPDKKQIYKNLAETEKQIYQQKLQEYHKKMEEYNEAHPDLSESLSSSPTSSPIEKGVRTRSKSKKFPEEVEKKNSKPRVSPLDPNKPRKPPTGYLLFAHHIRPQIKQLNPKMKITELGKLTGEKWRILSDEEKKTFLDQAEELKQKYLIELELYQKKKQEEEPKKNGNSSDSNHSSTENDSEHDTNQK